MAGRSLVHTLAPRRKGGKWTSIHIWVKGSSTLGRKTCGLLISFLLTISWGADNWEYITQIRKAAQFDYRYKMKSSSKCRAAGRTEGTDGWDFQIVLTPRLGLWQPPDRFLVKGEEITTSDPEPDQSSSGVLPSSLQRVYFPLGRKALRHNQGNSGAPAVSTMLHLGGELV